MQLIKSSRMKFMAEESKAESKTLGYILLILAAFNFAVIMEAVSALDSDLDWQFAVLARGLFGCLVALPIALHCIKKFDFFHKILMLRSVLTVIVICGIFYSVSIIPAGDATAIISTQPIWIGVISIFVFGYRYFIRFWFACLVVVLGVILLVASKPPDSMSVVFLLFVVTFIRGFSVILLRSLKDVPSTLISLHFAILALVGGLVVFLLSGGHHKLDSVLDTKGIFLLLLIGGGASVFQILFARVVVILGSIAGGMVGIIAVVFAYVMDLYLKTGTVDLLHDTGLLLVIIPTAWIVLSKHVQKQN